MLRQEVINQWNRCKTKLATVRLTPEEKETWKFMNGSKTFKFTVHNSYTDLDQLKKDIEAEQRNNTDFDENEMLCDYWLCWDGFGRLILDWIYLKMKNVEFLQEITNKEGRIETFEGIRDKITNFSEVNYAYHNDEPTTFYAVARSKWPTISAGEDYNPFFHHFISSISNWADFGKAYKEIKEIETKWEKEIYPKIKGAFYD